MQTGRMDPDSDMYKSGGSINAKDLNKANRPKFLIKHVSDMLKNQYKKSDYPNGITMEQRNELIDQWFVRVARGILDGDYILLNPSYYLGKIGKREKRVVLLIFSKLLANYQNRRAVGHLESTSIWVHIIHLKNN